jgi:hypothetical protein
MSEYGAKLWYFPDGYLPQKSDTGGMEAHEALMLLNINSSTASILLDFYFDDRPPIKGIAIAIAIGAERVLALRLDHPEDIGGINIPVLTQYAIRVRADLDIIAQFGRLDTTQCNMAYYTSMGYAVDA